MVCNTVITSSNLVRASTFSSQHSFRIAQTVLSEAASLCYTLIFDFALFDSRFKSDSVSTVVPICISVAASLAELPYALCFMADCCLISTFLADTLMTAAWTVKKNYQINVFNFQAAQALDEIKSQAPQTAAKQTERLDKCILNVV